MPGSTLPDTLTVTYGAASYDVNVTPADRTTIGVRVKPDLSIHARVPQDIEREELHGLVEAKAGWIARQIREFAKLHPLPSEKRYVSGETHTYLGRRYRLKVRSGPESNVALRGRYFDVVTPDKKDIEAIQQALNDWYGQHARDFFRRRLDRVMAEVQKAAIPDPKEVIVRTMATRWGSCSPRGRITLNTELVKTPVDCIDYVIAHELCHLLVPDHSRKYWALLSKVMPDWQRRREKLKGFRP